MEHKPANRAKKKPSRHSQLRTAAWVIGALVLVTGAFFVSRPRSAAVAESTGSSVADECLAALGYPARSASDLAWLRSCASSLTPPTSGATTAPTTDAPAATPSPTAKPTTSPSPSAGSDGSPPTGCVASPARCGYPDASSTGPKTGITLASYTGPSRITVAGTVIQNVKAGCLEIAAPDVILRNVQIACGNSGYAVDTTGTADTTGTTTVDHVEVVCTGHGGTAFGDARMTISYSDISRCENGADADGNVSITHSYIHDMFLGDSVVSDPHTDGIQVWPGAPAIVFSHNTVLMHDANATFTSGYPSGGPSAHLTVDGNLLDGGNYTVYCSNNVGSLVNNRFGPLGTNYQAPFGYVNACATMNLAGNINDVTGALLSLAALS